MSPRISLDDAGDEKNHTRIINTQIREILNQQPVTKMVNRRELRLYGAPNYGWQQAALESMGEKRVEGP